IQVPQQPGAVFHRSPDFPGLRDIRPIIASFTNHSQYFRVSYTISPQPPSRNRSHRFERQIGEECPLWKAAGSDPPGRRADPSPPAWRIDEGIRADYPAPVRLSSARPVGPCEPCRLPCLGRAFPMTTPRSAFLAALV